MWGLLKFTTMLGIKQRQVYHGSGADLQLGSLWSSTHWQTTHSVLWPSIITPTVMKKHVPSDVIPTYSAGSRPVEIRREFWWEEYSSGNIHDCVLYVKCAWVTTIHCVYELLHWFWLAHVSVCWQASSSGCTQLSTTCIVCSHVREARLEARLHVNLIMWCTVLFIDTRDCRFWFAPERSSLKALRYVTT